MHGQVVQPTGILQYLIPIGVFIVIFAVRARRMSQLRRLRLETLWVVPAIYLAIVVANFVKSPPTQMAWIASLCALIVGAAVGWQRGRLMQIHVDPATHELNQKGSPWAMLFLVAIVGIKLLAQGEGRAMGFDVLLVTDAALAFGLGMFTTTRVEMFLRARRLLDEARASGTSRA